MSHRSFLSISLLLAALATLSCAANSFIDTHEAGVAAQSATPEDAEAVVQAYDVEEEEQTSEEYVSPPFALSEGQPGWDGGEARPHRAQATPLTQEQVQHLLERLPPVQAEEGDVEQVRLPDQGPPPPRPGVEVELPFPPPQTERLPDDGADTPLAVLRYSPEGDVSLAPQLSVTFNQAMVPLSSHQELAWEEVPVRLSPAVPGRWRWVGTKTLLFEPEVEGLSRMPMATEYAVEIPAGTETAGGQKLAQPVSWTFRTPSPTLQESYPTDGKFDVEPVIFASFDQRIDPAAVVELAQVTAGGSSYAVRLAREDEVAADERVQRLAAEAHRDHWLAFVPVGPLPRETTVTVTFPAGTPSLEGPLVSAQPQSFSFQTPGPFALHEHSCGYEQDGPCDPMSGFYLTFTNPLDADQFDVSLISIEPDMPILMGHVSGDSFYYVGNVVRGTTYTVTVGAGLTDRFGQTLQEDVQVQFRIARPGRRLESNAGALAVLDPYGQPFFPITTVNVDAVKVRAFRVEPEQVDNYMRWRSRYLRKYTSSDPPGELAADRILEIGGAADELIETRIDLSEILPARTGHVILHVETVSSANYLGEDAPVISWIQATGIGLDAFVEGEGMLVWANRLEDGAPLSGVELSLLPGNDVVATGDDGIAWLPLTQDAKTLIARTENDAALLPASRLSMYGASVSPMTFLLADDRAWGPVSPWWERPEYRFYVFDDRGIYRPGEEVSIKGWLRKVEAGADGDVTLLPGSEEGQIEYSVWGYGNAAIAKGSAPLSPLGGFHFQFDLPEEMNLGPALVKIWWGEEVTYRHTVQVQEFRRPEFEVGARISEGPHIAGGHALATVRANYFAGGPLAAAEVDWSVEAREGRYSPPNWSGFAFGKWSPWWRTDGFAYDVYDDLGYYMPFDLVPVIPIPEGVFFGGEGANGFGSSTFTSRTDMSGVHALRIDFLGGDNGADGAETAATGGARPYPVSIGATATVMDVNRQAWSSRADLLLHPADLYVGLRSTRNFVEGGEPLTIEAVVTDLDGNAIKGHPVLLRAARLERGYRDGEWRETEQNRQECSVKTTAASSPHDTEHGFAACSFAATLGGEYRITAIVEDDAGRRSQTELTRWVSGGRRPPSRAVEREQIELIPDGDNYAAGDVARILVQAPFFPAEGLVTVRREGLVATERFTMDGPTHTLQLPIEEKHIPNIDVQVNLVGSTARVDDEGNEISSAPPRPAYARGRLNLSIPPLSRTLRVEAVPRAQKLEPGAETTIDVMVRNAKGEPVADAEFAVVVVDEAILALTGFESIDPLTVFYRERLDLVRNFHSRAALLLAAPPDMMAMMSEMMKRGVPMGAAAAPAAAEEEVLAGPSLAEAAKAAGGNVESILVRRDYDPLALFAPDVRTDADGRASVPVTLPDNLTRYRVMVVAVAGGKYFGSGESGLTGRLPLMVRPSAPRFLNFGDSFELPVVLQNQTGEAMETHIVVRATNAEVVTESGESGAAGYAVTVPANDRVEVRIPTTTASAGTARFQFGAIDANQPSIADAAEVDLPVFTPATTEAFAVYGEIDESGAVLQTLRPPSEAAPNFGGLEVTVSSTALQALTDAFIYLVRYPYECSEQIASRILGVAALRDVLTAFDAEGLPSPAELEETMQRDLQKLEGLQEDNGGFPIWRRGGEVWPYHSIHVAHALARAQLKGYAVPEEMLSHALDYLRNIEEQFPSRYGPGARRGLSSYALYVRKLLNDSDPSKARALVSSAGLEDLSLESVGWLLFVLTDDPASQETVEEMRRFLNNRVTETAGAPTVVSGYSDGDYLLLHSSRRADAVLLEALVVDQPDSDLITKLVRGLLGQRKAGRWGNTQENVWVLLAMDRYFNTFEPQTPDYVARIWLGGQYAGGHTFAGRSAEKVELGLPMAFVWQSAIGAEGDLPLILQKDGQGRLYYRLGLRYAPADLRLDAADHGFSVERVYEAVDDPEDVRRDGDGVWHIRAGARVRVRLTMAAPARRVHVALVDPLPAGLEILNPDLAVSGDVLQDPNGSRAGRWWWRNWYQHQNLRDERAEAFTSYLWAGVHGYSYMARATTPGAFVAPPAKAEEMYAPETFGRSGTDWVVVEVDEE